MADALAKLIISLIIGLALDVLFAQLAVWGLSYMHIGTGLPGPYLILAAISGVVTLNSPSKK